MTKDELLEAAKESQCDKVLEAQCLSQFGHTSIADLSETEFKTLVPTARSVLAQAMLQTEK